MSVESLLAPEKLVGWVGQACFFARFFVQWLVSERARRSLVPRSFWWLSLVGATLTGAYALQQGTTLLLFGYLVSAAIAARNLVLVRRGALVDARWAALAAVVVVGVSIWIELALEQPARSEPAAWLALGMLGQALWVTRFPLQWWLSERAGRSHFPPAFWWLSLAGNALLLAYALHLGDPVFVLGFLPGPLLQARNLVLERRSAQAA